jgi:peptide/nickel transport system substrate-binding protein
MNQAERVIRGMACGALALILVGATTETQAASYQEAPGLKALVSAGKLPPVEQRLPAQPLVLKPLEEIGKYGGTWRQTLRGGNDNLIERTIGYTRLVRWNLKWTDVVPDVAESVAANDDATRFVFKLRPGTKWSDGQPFTADDIMFWYEDVLLNKDLTPSVPAWLRSNGKPVKVEKLGEYEVAFVFDSPNGLFLANMATVRGSEILASAPRHYLKKFHAKYNPDGVKDLAAAVGAADWKQLFSSKVSFPSRWRDIERPVLDGWKLTVPYVGTTQVVAERNPYYFKVDTAGNQLPYIDRVTYDIIAEDQAAVLKAISGEIDMQTRSLDQTEARPVLVENQKRGDYRLFIAEPAWSNAMLININQTVKNPDLRKVFSRKDFRIGLSYAIDREEMNQVIYAGQGTPYQGAPREGTALYDEGMAKQYTEHDLAKANEHLDKAGLTKRDSDGFRLGDDGKRISFSIDVLSTEKRQIDALELVKRYWREVGIDMHVNSIERSFLVARQKANDYQGIAWLGGGGYDLLGLLDPKWYFPFEYESSFAGAWGIYYQNPKDPNAEEPSEPAKKQQALYRKLQATPTTEGQITLMKQILAITKEQFYVIGTNLEPDRVGIVKTGMRNVPERMPNTMFYMTPGPANAEQYFYKK